MSISYAKLFELMNQKGIKKVDLRDHVLLETLPRFIVFRNVKTGKEVAKDLGQLKSVLGKAHDVKEFYESHYKDEVTGGIFDMANPSSRLTSSSFK